jgi:N-methylhydantoinase A/oxoprolinase/acetone carboxylase beta subunit
MIIGLDVGGTNTDVVLLSDEGIVRQVKVPTNQSDLLNSVWTGLEEVTRDIPPESIHRTVLSTTLTTNCIAECKLTPVGMIVSSGPGIDPEHFRTGEYYYAVSGSIDHRGREICPIDPTEIEAIASRLKAEGIRHVGVAGKFSTRNPRHELQIKEILGDDFEYIILGHTISGNLSFPRRIATAYINATVYPTHKRFFEAVRSSLERKGFTFPIYILKADGGTMSLDSSLGYPGQTILSGPAASVMGSLPFASQSEETLVLDIGGTTTDMAVLIQQVPLLDPLGIEIGGYKTLIRSLKTHSIGLGGDSVVRLIDGRLKIGPDRQGPPMAYGGPAPTTTDALFVLGQIVEGDREASWRGLSPLAEQMGVSVEEAARRIFDEACKNILSAAADMIADINSKPVYTVHELLEGHQVKPKEILVLGGPAPYFAMRFAALTDFHVTVVPQWQVANAVGAALARTTSEITLFVDTERGIASIPEEAYYEPIMKDFDRKKAVDLAYEMLRKKALQSGANPGDLEMELLEDVEFKMVRGFYTTGRNIRVRVQVKPGLIQQYRSVAGLLTSYCPIQEKTG